MTELKTLKDLEYPDVDGCHPDGRAGLIKRRLLKQEAIKIIQSIRETRDCEGCPISKVPAGRFSKYAGCPAGDPQGCGFVWGLMWFFNITKEDLK